jgi:DNA-binding MarR family transcriptional regulator
LPSQKITLTKTTDKAKNSMIDQILSTILTSGDNGISQTEISKKFSLDSRDSSRLVGTLEKHSLIIREKMLYKGRWTYKLVVKKSPLAAQFSRKSIEIESIERAPCFSCSHQHSCSLEDDTSQYNPAKCMWIEEWVLASNSNIITQKQNVNNA